ncbi:hypothetical protein DIPPA_08793 [Diplonema papillatum]|nr:hypothetical protein DIPPA_08793 [Diplonema papillatum]
MPFAGSATPPRRASVAGGGPAAAAPAADAAGNEDGVPSAPPSPSGEAEQRARADEQARLQRRLALVFAQVGEQYGRAVDRLHDRISFLFASPAASCCVPVDFLLQGSDGLYQKRHPSILKHLYRPLEQRLLLAAVESRTDPTKYIDPDTGIMRSLVDPLGEHPVGPFDEAAVMGNVSWSERIRPTVCTVEGPVRRGWVETYQLDVHVSEVFFVTHPCFTAATAAVARLEQLDKDFRRLTKPAKPASDGRDDSLSPLLPPPSVSRSSAERRVEDLLVHLIRASASGAHGEALARLGAAVAAQWAPRLEADGVVGRNTIRALSDFLSAVTADVEDRASGVFDMVGRAGPWAGEEAFCDCLSDLPRGMLIALRHWIATEGTRLKAELPSPEQTLTGVPYEWWDHAAVPADEFGLLERRALQIILNVLFPSDPIVIDGVVAASTVVALQTHLLNTRHDVQLALHLPAKIHALEAAVKAAGIEPEILRQLSDAIALRDAAVEQEVGILREMLSVWHTLKHLGVPPNVSFGLVRRYPTPDAPPLVPGADPRMQPTALLKQRAPQLRIAPDYSVNADAPLLYKCKFFVRPRGGDGRGRYAAETEWRPLCQDFHVRPSALVRLHLAKEPEAILVQVIQRGRPFGTPCGHITITPPFGTSPFEPGAAAHAAEHRGGTWYPFRSEMGEGRPETSGAVLAEAFWSQSDPGVPSKAPQPSNAETVRLGFETVVKEVMAGRLDPNDPVHQPLMKRLAERRGTSLISKSKRRHVAQEQQTGSLASVLLPPGHDPPRAGTLDRVELLAYRWHLMKNPSPAPRTDRQDRMLAGKHARPVPRNPSTSVWGRDAEVEAVEPAAVLSTDAWLAKIRRAKASITKPAQVDADVLRQVVTQPVVEEQFDLIAFVRDFFRPISKLRPYRKPQPEPSPEAASEKLMVLAYVKAASNVPIRCNSHVVDGRKPARVLRSSGSGFGAAELGLAADDKKPGDDDDEGTRDGTSDIFVEVRFGPVAPQRTRAAVGPDPLFFETLKLPIPVEEGKASTLALIDDSIEIRVFDKVRLHRPTPDLHRDADGRTVSYHEVKRYLGSCELPFHTLYASPRNTWEGTLTLDTPPVSLAYAQPSDLQPAAETPVDLTATVSLYLTLTPACPKQPTAEYLDARRTNEATPLFWLAQRWVAGCRKAVEGAGTSASAAEKNSDRARSDRTVALVNSATDQRSFLVTRFVRPDGIAPPKTVWSGDEGSEFELARFVACIPFLRVSAPAAPAAGEQGGGGVAGRVNSAMVWGTCADFLGVGAGSSDEHALLLANLFTWLTHPPQRRFGEVWVVLGGTDATPNAGFVLTKDAVNPTHWHLWDPVTGHRWPVLSKLCPLRDAAIAFNPTNVYCNVQPSGQPRRMQWDFFNPRCWSPLFPPGQTPPQETCQPDVSARDGFYVEIPADAQLKLQLLVADAVKAVIREQRSPVKNMLTTFRNPLDIHGRRVLDHVILPSLEQACCQGYHMGRGVADGEEAWLVQKHREVLDQHKAGLREALSSYEMHGFPLHFAWTDLQDIRRVVACTGVHATDPLDSNTEFAVGVYVKTLTRCNENTYASIWVYVASLKRNPDRWPAVT